MREDLDYFSRVSFLPDPTDPVDRWYQVPDGRSVAEQVALIAELPVRYGLSTPSVVVDPFAGAGGIVCATSNYGLATVCVEKSAVRASWALAKMIAVSDLRPGAEDFSRAWRSGPIKPLDPPIWPSTPRAHALILSAVLRAHLLDHPGELGILEAIRADLDGQRQTIPAGFSRVYWGHVEDVAETVAGQTPLLILTSPPHPRSRAAHMEKSTLSYRAAEALLALLRVGEKQNDRSVAPFSPSHSLTPLLAVAAAKSAVIYEFEVNPQDPDRLVDVLSILATLAWDVVDVVQTYRSAPDDPSKGAGGYVVATKR